MLQEFLVYTLTGNGTASSYVPVHGDLTAVHYEYAGTAAGTIALCMGTTTVLTITPGTTAWYYPRTAVCNSSGSSYTYDGTRTVVEPVPVNDYMTVVTTGMDAADTLNARIFTRE